ncbi:MAG TPA: hypothetical protein VK917_09665 [Ilumatobacter sp.]|nr:hypothetical protein [Ilumatobacter sp.]
MIRRTALPLACVAAMSGCATFTQDDVVASFNGVELDQAEFDERYAAVAGDPVDGRIDAEPARTIVTNWILEQVLAEAGVVERYESGPEASGILCVSLVRVSDIVAAEDLVERLEQGAVWTDVLSAEFPEAPDNGDVGCIPTETLGPLTPQVAGMSLDDPYAVFLFDDQNAGVLRMRPTAEVDPLEIAGIVQTIDPDSLAGIGELFETADVTVDPQFGQFDPAAGGVVALG